MKASQVIIDGFIDAALSFGTALPSSVNEQLVDNGYEPLPAETILKRAAEKLAAEAMEEK